MTNQEAFDAVVKGLASQGWQQSKGPNGCAYRGADGRKCALGWLIPDDRYQPEFDASCGVQTCPPYVIREAGLTVDVSFARELQDVHDSSADMKTGYRQIAFDHGLAWPPELL